MHSNIVLMILIFLLTGCYPCKFLDCNCVTETAWYKASEKCDNEQISVAKENVKEKSIFI